MIAFAFLPSNLFLLYKNNKEGHLEKNNTFSYLDEKWSRVRFSNNLSISQRHGRDDFTASDRRCNCFPKHNLCLIEKRFCVRVENWARACVWCERGVDRQTVFRFLAFADFGCVDNQLRDISTFLFAAFYFLQSDPNKTTSNIGCLFCYEDTHTNNSKIS